MIYEVLMGLRIRNGMSATMVSSSSHQFVLKELPGQFKVNTPNVSREKDSHDVVDVSLFRAIYIDAKS